MLLNFVFSLLYLSVFSKYVRYFLFTLSSLIITAILPFFEITGLLSVMSGITAFACSANTVFLSRYFCLLCSFSFLCYFRRTLIVLLVQPLFYVREYRLYSLYSLCLSFYILSRYNNS